MKWHENHFISTLLVTTRREIFYVLVINEALTGWFLQVRLKNASCRGGAVEAIASFRIHLGNCNRLSRPELAQRHLKN